ncbi:MAG: o-succinylbenzoate synthase [Xenococcaceae cyanobacterium MO_167.B27]|nr:o-succinylbenzoate synthase [Xenococcaceae cyanobacterium MO_167.B27]
MLLFQFQSYRRNFIQPLHTSHGIWRVREGIIITLRNSEGKIGQGEIAPIPWFGSETLQEAQEFCKQLGDTITVQDIYSICDRLPCCQFAFESAVTELRESEKIAATIPSLEYCHLLPAGNKVLQQNLSSISTSTFKWKIGVYPIEEEIAILQQLIKQLPKNSQLRLDANGGLNLSQAQQWLTVADNCQIIEFIEQPLPPDRFSEMLALSTAYKTTLALDESVANLKQLETCYQKGWRGVFVIKAAIAGSPSRLGNFCASHPIDVVFSSVFETSIGRRAVLKLAMNLGNCDRAVGFGVDHWLRN